MTDDVNAEAGAEEMVFRVSAQEAATILEALGNLRFVQVYQLIDKLQTQARDQLAPTPGERS